MSHPRLTGQERRAGIIQAAIRLFAEKGFRGTTTRELASAVGVSEPVLYQHFNTKSDLYTAILEHIAKNGEEAIPECDTPTSFTAGDVRPYLTNLATSIIEWHKTNPDCVRLLLLSALEGHEFNQLFYERYFSAFFASLRTYFEAGIRQGIFRDQDPTIPAQAFLWLVAHYSLELTLFHKTKPAPHSLPEEQTVAGIIDIFLKGTQACTETALHTHSPSAYSSF